MITREWAKDLAVCFKTWAGLHSGRGGFCLALIVSKAALTLDSSRREDFVRLLSDISSGSSMALEGIVYLSALDTGDPDVGSSAWEEHPDLGCTSVLNLVQAMSGTPWNNPPGLIVVTCGAVVVGERSRSRKHPTETVCAVGSGPRYRHRAFGISAANLSTSIHRLNPEKRSKHLPERLQSAMTVKTKWRCARATGMRRAWFTVVTRAGRGQLKRLFPREALTSWRFPAVA